MKNIKYIIFTTILLLGMACSESFFDINHDPNKTEVTTPELLVPSIESSTCYVLGGWFQILGAFWSQHWTQSTGAGQWSTIDDYAIKSDDFDRQYRELFAGSLMDAEVLRNITAKSKNWTYYLVATCMQAYTYQVLADIYGKIPFTEALQGIKNMTPKFDEGELIYDSLIARLDFALNQDFTVKSTTNPTATSIEIGPEDILLGGDIDAWVQFANTLKLKLFLRQVNARPAIAEAGIKALLAEDNFLLSDVKMTSFKDEENGRNPVYETGMDRLTGNLVASATLVDALYASGDSARVDALFIRPSDGNPSQVALIQGHYKIDQPTYPNIQSLSTPNVTGLSPVYLFSNSEVLFLMSEANLRYGDATLANTLYNQGVEAAFAKVGATFDVALIAAGGAYEYPAIGSFNDQLKAIIVQKWIALANDQSLESFFDQNRTGYPDFYTISPTNQTNNQFPRRLPYPDSETKSNPNTPALVPITTPVWWAKK
jgi:hypothetical protein